MFISSGAFVNGEPLGLREEAEINLVTTLSREREEVRIKKFKPHTIVTANGNVTKWIDVEIEIRRWTPRVVYFSNRIPRCVGTYRYKQTKL